MSDNNTRKSLSFALGAAFVSALTAGAVNAAANPFGQTELHGGYMVADNHADTATMEGKSGAMNKDKMKEGTCGEMGKMQQEGKCGAMGKAHKEGDKAATPEMPDHAVKPE